MLSKELNGKSVHLKPSRENLRIRKKGNSDTAPATVGKNVRLYDHCASIRHGKVT